MPHTPYHREGSLPPVPPSIKPNTPSGFDPIFGRTRERRRAEPVSKTIIPALRRQIPIPQISFKKTRLDLKFSEDIKERLQPRQVPQTEFDPSRAAGRTGGARFTMVNDPIPQKAFEEYAEFYTNWALLNKAAQEYLPIPDDEDERKLAKDAQEAIDWLELRMGLIQRAVSEGNAASLYEFIEFDDEHGNLIRIPKYQARGIETLLNAVQTPAKAVETGINWLNMRSRAVSDPEPIESPLVQVRGSGRHSVVEANFANKVQIHKDQNKLFDFLENLPDDRRAWIEGQLNRIGYSGFDHHLAAAKDLNNYLSSLPEGLNDSQLKSGSGHLAATSILKHNEDEQKEMWGRLALDPILWPFVGHRIITLPFRAVRVAFNTDKLNALGSVYRAAGRGDYYASFVKHMKTLGLGSPEASRIIGLNVRMAPTIRGVAHRGMQYIDDAARRTYNYAGTRQFAGEHQPSFFTAWWDAAKGTVKQVDQLAGPRVMANEIAQAASAGAKIRSLGSWLTSKGRSMAPLARSLRWMQDDALQASSRFLQMLSDAMPRTANMRERMNFLKAFLTDPDSFAKLPGMAWADSDIGGLAWATMRQLDHVGQIELLAHAGRADQAVITILAKAATRLYPVALPSPAVRTFFRFRGFLARVFFQTPRFGIQNHVSNWVLVASEVGPSGARGADTASVIAKWHRQSLIDTAAIRGYGGPAYEFGGSAAADLADEVSSLLGGGAQFGREAMSARGIFERAWSSAGSGPVNKIRHGLPGGTGWIQVSEGSELMMGRNAYSAGLAKGHQLLMTRTNPRFVHPAEELLARATPQQRAILYQIAEDFGSLADDHLRMVDELIGQSVPSYRSANVRGLWDVDQHFGAEIQALRGREGMTNSEFIRATREALSRRVRHLQEYIKAAGKMDDAALAALHPSPLEGLSPQQLMRLSSSEAASDTNAVRHGIYKQVLRDSGADEVLIGATEQQVYMEGIPAYEAMYAKWEQLGQLKGTPEFDRLFAVFDSETDEIMKLAYRRSDEIWANAVAGLEGGTNRLGSAPVREMLRQNQWTIAPRRITTQRMEGLAEEALAAMDDLKLFRTQKGQAHYRALFKEMHPGEPIPINRHSFRSRLLEDRGGWDAMDWRMRLIKDGWEPPFSGSARLLRRQGLYPELYMPGVRVRHLGAGPVGVTAGSHKGTGYVKVKWIDGDRAGQIRYYEPGNLEPIIDVGGMSATEALALEGTKEANALARNLAKMRREMETLRQRAIARRVLAGDADKQFLALDQRSQVLSNQIQEAQIQLSKMDPVSLKNLGYGDDVIEQMTPFQRRHAVEQRQAYHASDFERAESQISIEGLLDQGFSEDDALRLIANRQRPSWWEAQERLAQRGEIQRLRGGARAQIESELAEIAIPEAMEEQIKFIRGAVDDIVEEVESAARTTPDAEFAELAKEYFASPEFREFQTVGRAQTTAYAGIIRDTTLLNYGQRYNIEYPASFIMGWPFWTTRTGWYTAQRLANRPWMLATYGHMKRLQWQVNQDLPESFKDTIPLPGGFRWNPEILFNPVFGWIYGLDSMIDYWGNYKNVKDPGWYQGVQMVMAGMGFREFARLQRPYFGMDFLGGIPGLDMAAQVLTNDGTEPVKIGAISPWGRILEDVTGRNYDRLVQGTIVNAVQTLRRELGMDEADIQWEDEILRPFAYRVLLQWKLDGEISQEVFDEAIASEAGPLWDKALKQSRGMQWPSEMSSYLFAVRARSTATLEAQTWYENRRKEWGEFYRLSAEERDRPARDEWLEENPEFIPFSRRYDTVEEKERSLETSAYLEAAGDLRENQLERLNTAIIGRPWDWNATQDLKDEQFAEREELAEKYPDREELDFSVFGATPEQLDEKISGNIWRLIAGNRPKREDHKTREAYERAEEIFWSTLPKVLLAWPEYREMRLRLEAHIAKGGHVLPDFDGLAAQAAASGFEGFIDWTKLNDTLYEAAQSIYRWSYIESAYEEFPDYEEILNQYGAEEAGQRYRNALLKLYHKYADLPAVDFIPAILDDYDEWTRQELQNALMPVAFPGFYFYRWIDAPEDEVAEELIETYYFNLSKDQRKAFRKAAEDRDVRIIGYKFGDMHQDDYEVLLAMAGLTSPWDDQMKAVQDGWEMIRKHTPKDIEVAETDGDSRGGGRQSRGGRSSESRGREGLASLDQLIQEHAGAIGVMEDLVAFWQFGTAMSPAAAAYVSYLAGRYGMDPAAFIEYLRKLWESEGIFEPDLRLRRDRDRTAFPGIT